ncbi:hypothetical protein HPG69_016710 [Diceros bicornis minor]|uniref:Uncharacterized protein n=1 Tax=Diceros bicornis minor TaxID=77932 RepID=A0A7J7F9N2_DICBM|nr:hypothetical protein HPG69_016710 [Diceros bicornis minor]
MNAGEPLNEVEAEQIKEADKMGTGPSTLRVSRRWALEAQRQGQAGLLTCPLLPVFVAMMTRESFKLVQ